MSVSCFYYCAEKIGLPRYIFSTKIARLIGAWFLWSHPIGKQLGTCVDSAFMLASFHLKCAAKYDFKACFS